ncbi:MAG TPA: glycosyltransferase [Bryobacteraceae bacterium]|jgi:GT2 family glycosyltransferase
MQSETPLVSIVVPAYNAERFLRASLDSIIGQTYPAIEILVMDDASTDGTGEIARSYGDRITYHRQPQNRGQFGNVDDGVARARGKYIAVYHADDVYLPEIVARETAFLEAHPGAGAVFAIEIFIDGDGRERGRLELPPEVHGRELLDYATVLNTLLCYKNRIFCGPSSMIRASVYRSIGPYRGREFPVAGDFEMFLRIARKHPVGILDQHLMRYRWGHGNADQMDRRLRTTEEPYFSIMDEHLREGGLSMARRDALAAHEAHRAEDALMRSVNCYILDRRASMKPILREISLRQILGSPKVQRYRLSALYLGLLALARLPYVPAVARLFRNRWYASTGGKTIVRQGGSQSLPREATAGLKLG